MPEETKTDWHIIQNDEGYSRTERMRIQDGWLYRTIVANSVSMIFIPDTSDEGRQRINPLKK